MYFGFLNLLSITSNGSIKFLFSICFETKYNATFYTKLPLSLSASNFEDWTKYSLLIAFHLSRISIWTLGSGFPSMKSVLCCPRDEWQVFIWPHTNETRVHCCLCYKLVSPRNTGHPTLLLWHVFCDLKRKRKQNVASLHVQSATIYVGLTCHARLLSES